MTKQFRVVGLAVALLAAASAGAQDISLPVITEGDIGQQVQVPVTVANAPNLVDALGFNLGFDPAVLQFDGFDFTGGLLADFSFASANSGGAGVVIVGAFTFTAGTQIDPGDDGLLGVATFTILDCPSSPSALTLSSLVDDISVWTSANGSFQCDVGPTCEPIIANDDEVSVDEDDSVVIELTASGGSGPFTFIIESGPSNGDLSMVNGAMVTYTPDPNFNGSDSFTFVVDDGCEDGADKSLSNVATVSITVNPTNDPPVAENDDASTNEDMSVTFDLTAMDIDGDALTYSIVSDGTIGSAVVNGDGPSVTYTPNANANGSDSFTFVANDGTVDSNVATISVTVNPVNDPPVANNDAVSTDEDTFVTFDLVASDIDGDSLTYSIVSNGTKGTAVVDGDGPSVTYTPNPDWNGSDSFTFVANDGTVDSNVATVTVTINPINDPPVPVDQDVETNENTPVTIFLEATDDSIEDAMMTTTETDGFTGVRTNLVEAITFTIIIPPTNGTLGPVIGDMVEYTPDPNFTGTDFFTFRANDGELDSLVDGRVDITVNDLDDCTLSLVAEDGGVPGETVTYTLDVGNSPEIDAFGVDVLFDPNVLAFVGGEVGGLTIGFENFDAVEAESGRVVVGGFTTINVVPAGSNGTLAALQFMVLTCPGDPSKGVIINDSTLELIDPVDDIAECILTNGTFSCENREPVADAGEDVNGAAVGEKVTLDGSNSFDPDPLDMITFSWEFSNVPQGSQAVLEMADTAMPCFTPDLPGTYEICLTVRDNSQLDDVDCVVVEAVDVSTPCPIADAGDNQEACVGEKVFLDGSGSSDPEPGPSDLSFLWEFDAVPGGSQAEIMDAETATPCFTPDVEGVYTLKLTVFDGDEVCDNPGVTMDFVDVTANVNSPPNADAGLDQQVTLGGDVTLDATGSDDPDDMPEPLTFAWTLLSTPLGSALTSADIVDADQATASFTPDVSGFFVARVEVSDGKDSDFDNVVIAVGEKVKQDVTELFDIMTANGQSVLDPVTRIITSTKDLKATNTSDTVVCAPIQIIVSISDEGMGEVSMPGADSVDMDGNFIFNVGVDLEPGSMVELDLLFEYPIGIAFLFDVEICGEVLEFPAVEPVK